MRVDEHDKNKDPERCDNYTISILVRNVSPFQFIFETTCKVSVKSRRKQFSAVIANGMTSSASESGV